MGRAEGNIHIMSVTNNVYQQKYYEYRFEIIKLNAGIKLDWEREQQN